MSSGKQKDCSWMNSTGLRAGETKGSCRYVHVCLICVHCKICTFENEQCLSVSNIQKVGNCLRTLESLQWTEENKKKVLAVIEDKAYNSSEYSESEEDTQDDGGRIYKLVVKSLPWQRTRLSSIKKILDEQYKKQLSNRAKSMLTKRVRRGQSTRPLPKNAKDHS